MPVLEIEATVTSRGQTTLPSAIRRALKVGTQGAIVFRIEESGQVTLAKKDSMDADPVIGQFLSFLAADMMARPDALRPVTADWLAGLQYLVKDVAIDLEASLSAEDE